MNFIKRTILFVLSLLPMKAFSFAADFQQQIDIAQVDELDMHQEFVRWHDSDFLPEFYYRDLEEAGVFQIEDLDLPEQQYNKGRFLKKFTADWMDNKLMSAATNSAVPD